MSSTSVSGFFPRVSLRFARTVDTILSAFTRNIVTQVTGNPVFPTPSPALTVITAAVDDFDVKIQEALNGGRIEVVSRNASRAALVSVLRQLAAYVQGQASGDFQSILSSGFEAVRAPSPVGQLPPPENARLGLTGLTGGLLFRFGRVSNAANYSVQYGENPAGPWTDHNLSSSTRATITGLTPGTMYWARVRANGADGPSAWTAPTCAMAI